MGFGSQLYPLMGALRWNVVAQDSGDAIGENCFFGRIHNGDALLGLGRASSLKSLEDMAASYRIARTKIALAAGSPDKAISVAMGESRRMMLRIFFTYGLDGVCQIFVLSMLFVAKQSIVHGRAQMSASGPLIPLCLCNISLVVNLLGVQKYMALTSLVCSGVAEEDLHIEHHMCGTIGDGIAQIRNWRRLIALCVFGAVVCVVYNLATVSAVFYCEHSVWFPWTGCVGLDFLLKD